MDRIEQILNCTIPYREEVVSINKLRNCLVHRYGIIGKKDINNSSTNELVLKWFSLKSSTNINGHLTEITYDLRKDGLTVKGLTIEEIKNERKFKLGDKISLDINEFNGIAYTCVNFAKGLFNLMPRSKDINPKST